MFLFLFFISLSLSTLLPLLSQIFPDAVKRNLPELLPMTHLCDHLLTVFHYMYGKCYLSLILESLDCRFRFFDFGIVYIIVVFFEMTSVLVFSYCTFYSQWYKSVNSDFFFSRSHAIVLLLSAGQFIPLNSFYFVAHWCCFGVYFGIIRVWKFLYLNHIYNFFCKL